MAITFSTSAPRWARLRGTTPKDVARIVEAVEGSGIADVPGVKWQNDPSWTQLELPRNVMGTKLWGSVVDQLGVPAVPHDVVIREYAGLPGWLHGKLYPHQEEAVRFLSLAGSGLLADEMGLGKSRAAAVAALDLRARAGGGPSLIVGPLYTRAVWKRELAALGVELDHDWHQITTLEPKGDDVATLRSSSWWFIHPDIAHAWSGRFVGGALPRPKVAIVDEAHWHKTPTSRRAKATHAVVGTIPHRILLTGTPMSAATPRDLWSLLVLVTGAYSWGSHAAFRVRYCGAINDGYGLRDTEPTYADELTERMEGIYLRRTIADVGINLPPLTREPLLVEGRAVAVGGSNLHAILQGLERGSFGPDTLRMMMKLAKGTSAIKRPVTVAHVENLVAQGESAVVFCHERQMTERLSSDIEGSIFIHGEQDQDERDRLVAAFQAGHGVALFATYGALREGVTLHRARHVVLHDLSWVVSDILQAEARVYRIGQLRATTSTWVMVGNSFDTLLAQHLIRKAAAIQATLKDGAAQTALAAVGLIQDAVEEDAKRLLAAWRTHHV
jgi:SNF2 family DNA or RNA helicase